MPVLSDSFFQSKDGLSQLEQLEIIVATQDLLLSEPVDSLKYLEDEGKLLGPRNLLQTYG